MTNLRELAESDLADTLEDPNQWGLPVVLIGPDGEIQGTEEVPLYGQVLYNRIEENPATGGEIIVKKPVAVLRISSLDPVPAPGENWAFRIPITPDLEADLVTWFAERPEEDGASIGFIRLYGKKIKQEEEE